MSKPEQHTIAGPLERTIEAGAEQNVATLLDEKGSGVAEGTGSYSTEIALSEAVLQVGHQGTGLRLAEYTTGDKAKADRQNFQMEPTWRLRDIPSAEC